MATEVLFSTASHCGCKCFRDVDHPQICTTHHPPFDAPSQHTLACKSLTNLSTSTLSLVSVARTVTMRLLGTACEGGLGRIKYEIQRRTVLTLNTGNTLAHARSWHTTGRGANGVETEVAGALGDASALMPTTGLLAAMMVFMMTAGVY